MQTIYIVVHPADWDTDWAQVWLTLQRHPRIPKAEEYEVRYSPFVARGKAVILRDRASLAAWGDLPLYRGADLGVGRQLNRRERQAHPLEGLTHPAQRRRATYPSCE
jgi:hypothetical protein